MSLLFCFFFLFFKVNNGTYSIETRIIALDMLINQQKTTQQVCQLIGVAVSTLYTWVQNMNNNGHVLTHHEMMEYDNRGVQTILTPMDFLLLVYIIDRHPTWYAYEISQSLWNRGGSLLSTQIVSKYRRRLKFRRKRSWRLAKEASLFQGWLFKNYILYLQLGVRDLVFLDESSFNARQIGERRWAYSLMYVCLLHIFYLTKYF